MRLLEPKRRVRPAWLAAALALLSACGAIPMRPRGEWVSAQTAHYEVASGLSARRTRELALRLERFRALALDFGALREPPASVPTRIVLFPHTRNFAALRPHRALSGYFQPTAHANYLAIDAERPETSFQIAQHEIVHLLQLGGGASPPAWWREGFADLLASARFVGDEAELGAAPGDHLALARVAPLPLARVLGARDVLRWRRSALEAFYAQSWALAHYLTLGGGAPSRAALHDFVTRIGVGDDLDAACRASLGRSLAALERELLAYVEREELPRVRVPAPRTRGGIVLAALPGAERDALLGDLAFSFGERRWRRAASLLDAALAQRPENAHTLATRAWLAAERGEEEAADVLAHAEEVSADAAANSASAHASRDAESARRLGEAWLALARAAPDGSAQRERVARAEACFAHSLALAPAHPAAQLGLARIERARGELERARARLAAARAALAAYPAAALELASSELSARAVDGARATISPVLADPHAAPRGRRERASLAQLLRDARLEEEADASLRHLAARLDLQAPAPGARATTDLPFAEVRGKAGFWEAARQDIALLIDVSNSTLDASGVDVDGDGRVGRTRGTQLPAPNERRGSSDRGDSIVRAEIAAAEQLLAELDPATTRVSLVLFTATARLAAPLGPPERALAALRRHRVHYDPTGTSFSEPLEVAFEDLLAQRIPGERSQRTILLLSDGEPTAPNRFEARTRALRVAGELARYGVRVHGFALGEDALDKSETLRDVAERSGGRFSVTGHRDISFLRDARITGLERVAIRNRTRDTAARAVRLFADGSFDALVPLTAGPNEIEVRAEVPGHEPLVATRLIERTPRDPHDASYAARADALRSTLRERTRALAARADLEAARSRNAAARDAERRTLEITPSAATLPAVGTAPPVSASPESVADAEVNRIEAGSKSK